MPRGPRDTVSGGGERHRLRSFLSSTSLLFASLLLASSGLAASETSARVDALRKRLAAVRNRLTAPARVEALGARLDALREDLEGPPDFLSEGGGGTELGNVGVEAGQTRWDAVKASLRELVRAYVSRDLSGVLGQLGRDIVPDRSIFSNAIQEDYQLQDDIMLDLELMNYRVDIERVCTEARWNRSAVRQANGIRRVEDGTCRLCFTREDEWKLSLAQGRLPFGLDDPAMQQQAATGQPNPDPQNATTRPLPQGQRVLNIDVDHRPGGTGNVAFLDLEAGTVRKATVAGDVDDLAGLPGEDVYVATDLQVATPPGVCVHVVNQAGVVGCDGGFDQPFYALRRIDTGRFVRVTDDVFGYHFGIRTSEGSFAFLRVADFQQASYVMGRDPLVRPGGSIDCP